MANHALPTVDSLYVDYTAQIKGRLEDQAKGFDPANTTATNINIGTIRWNSAENKDQKWTGTAWVDKSSNYVFNGITLSTGTANGVAYLNGSKALTTGSALTFDGTHLKTTGSVGVDGAVFTGGIWFDAFASFKSGIFSDATKTQLGFQANSSEQMRLTSTGLGIGTSSPARKLDVNGSIQIPPNNALYINGSNNYLYADTSATELASATQIKLVINGALRATLDSSGNLGLGVTPSAWSASAKAIQFGAYGAVYQNASGYPELAFNVFQNTSNSYIYRNTDVATRYSQTNGAHQWFTAPSGTAGNTISFTQAMTLDANGNLGIGTSSPVAKVHALTPSAAAVGFRAANSMSFAEFQVDASGNSQLIAPGGTQIFNTNGSERMRINASGNLLVGNTNGTSRITASGVIESTTGGFKFPDGTTQTTAATAPSTSNVLAATAGATVGAVGTYAMLRNGLSTALSYGDTVTVTGGFQLAYSDAGGLSSGFPPVGSTWRCMGYAAQSSAALANRVTLFLRIS